MSAASWLSVRRAHSVLHGVGSRKAFSLIELLSTIAIGTALISMLLPLFGSLREVSAATRCLSNIRQIGLGTLSYAAENNSVLPPGNSWDVQMLPYINAQNNPQGAARLFVCPVDWKLRRTSQRNIRSYTASGINPENTSMGVFSTAGDSNSKSTLTIASPSTTILFFEFFTDASGGRKNNYLFDGSFAYTYGYLTTTSIPKLKNGTYYHGQKANFAFADGHAATLPATEPAKNQKLWANSQ